MELISLGFEQLEEDLFKKPHSMYLACKPSGGLWCSPYTPDDKYISDWHRASTSMELDKHVDYGVIFNLRHDARIYTIDNYDDLHNLYEQYKLLSCNKEFMRAIKFYDWSKMAGDWDCIYLTSKGEFETRYTYPLSFSGWDCESMLILNFNVIENQRLWRRHES